MPYPYRIGNDDTNTPFTFNIEDIGPFEYNSALYAVFMNAVNDHIEVWRSTDAGVTWTQQNSGNEPIGKVITGSGNTLYQVRMVGSTLYVLYIKSTDEQAAIRPFDLATNTWTVASEVTGGPTPTNSGGSGIIHGSPSVTFERFSNGRYVVVYTSTETVGGQPKDRVRAKIWNGSSWVSDQMINTNKSGTSGTGDGLVGCILGADDLAHLFWYDGAYFCLFHRTLDSSGTLGSIQQIPTVGWDKSAMHLGIPMSYVDSCGDTWIVVPAALWNTTNAQVPYTSQTTIRPGIVRGKCALNPKWNVETAADETDGPSDRPWPGGHKVMSALWNSSTSALHLYWARKGEQTSTNYKIMTAANIGGGWSSPTALFDAGGAAGDKVHLVYARKIAAGVGIIFGSEDIASSDTYGYPHYHQFSLSTSGAPSACGASSSGAAYYAF